MAQFNFETIAQTEKAIFAKVPYHYNNKQLSYECWIPKYILEKGTAKEFVIRKKKDERLSNSYLRSFPVPDSWETMGEYINLNQ